MQGIIIYNSKYGATQQYAEWLAAETKLRAVPDDDVSEIQVENADYLLIGTPVYFGKFRIRSWLKKNLRAIKGKKIFFFIVNASSPEEHQKREGVVQQNIPPELRTSSEAYFLAGRVIHSKLSFFDRIMVKGGSSMQKDPAKKRAMLEDLDGVKRENLQPVINALTRYLGRKKTTSEISSSSRIL